MGFSVGGGWVGGVAVELLPQATAAKSAVTTTRKMIVLILVFIAVLRRFILGFYLCPLSV
ncbi:MAG: hypothetical protein IIB32_04965 [Chloroflexi bacterium]|nr:hypothetical protein [Chloroflexota bacterium]